MARMVATKATLSIRVDALTDADGKSEPQAPSIGIENRAKLESRLRALEHQMDGSTVKRFQNGPKKQPKFEMSGGSKTYNPAADAVDLVSTQREPKQAAVAAVLDVKAEKKKLKEEKKRLKEERRAQKSAEKGKGREESADAMAVDVEEHKDKKRKRRDSDVNGEAPRLKVPLWLYLLCILA